MKHFIAAKSLERSWPDKPGLRQYIKAGGTVAVKDDKEEAELRALGVLGDQIDPETGRIIAKVAKVKKQSSIQAAIAESEQVAEAHAARKAPTSTPSKEPKGD